MIDPAGIPQITGDPDALTGHASTVTGVGTSFADTGSRIDGTWQELSGVYRAPEAETLFAATGPVRTMSADVGADLGVIGDALTTYATTVAEIKSRLETLRASATAFNSDIRGDDDWRSDENLVAEHNGLLTDVNAAVADFTAAQRTCANAILALYTDRRWTADNGDGEITANEFGYDAELLDAVLAQGDGELPWGSAEEHDRGFWGDVGAFFVGIGDGAVEMVVGLGALIGYADGDWSWGTAGTAWAGLGIFVGSALIYSNPALAAMDQTTGLFGQDRQFFGGVLLDAGKAIIAYDTWGEDPQRAAGMTVFNVVSAVVGTKGAGAALRGTGAAAQSSRFALVAQGGNLLVRGGNAIGRIPTVEDLVGSVRNRFSGVNVPDIDVPDVDVPTSHTDTPRTEIPNGAVPDVDGPSIDDAVRGADTEQPNTQHPGPGAGTSNMPDGGTNRAGDGTPDTDAPASERPDPAPSQAPGGDQPGTQPADGPGRPDGQDGPGNMPDTDGPGQSPAGDQPGTQPADASSRPDGQDGPGNMPDADRPGGPGQLPGDGRLDLVDADRPDPVRTDADDSNMGRGDTDQPVADRPDTDRPDADRPDADRPDPADTGRPDGDGSNMGRGDADQPVADQPPADRPDADQPGPAPDRDDAPVAVTPDADLPTGTQPDGSWIGNERGSTFTLDRTENDLADAALGRAADAEARITPQIQQIIGDVPGARPQGLEFVLKGEDSYKRKLATDLYENPDLTPTEAIAGVRDSVRYTMEIPSGNYVSGVTQAVDQLIARGYQPVTFKPTWGDPTSYRGLNSTWRDPATGQVFEMQFHTPESFAAKMEAHELYEAQRVPGTPPEQIRLLTEQMGRIFSDVPAPTGAVDELATLRDRVLALTGAADRPPVLVGVGADGPPTMSGYGPGPTRPAGLIGDGPPTMSGYDTPGPRGGTGAPDTGGRGGADSGGRPVVASGDTPTGSTVPASGGRGDGVPIAATDGPPTAAGGSGRDGGGGGTTRTGFEDGPDAGDGRGDRGGSDDASRPDTDRPDTDRPDADRPDTDGPDADRPDADPADTGGPDADGGDRGGSGGADTGATSPDGTAQPEPRQPVWLPDDPTRPNNVGHPLEAVDESRVVRDGSGLIDQVDGRPYREYLHDWGAERAQQLRDGRDSGAVTGRGAGPVSGVVLDRLTGEIVEGMNGRVGSVIPENQLHPLLAERMRVLEATDHPNLDRNGDPDTPRPYPHPEPQPLRHAEVKAVNELLWSREGMLRGGDPGTARDQTFRDDTIRDGTGLDDSVFADFQADTFAPFAPLENGRVPTREFCANCHILLGETASSAGRLTGFPPHLFPRIPGQ